MGRPSGLSQLKCCYDLLWMPAHSLSRAHAAAAVDTFSQSELMAIAQFIQDSQSQLTITGLFQLTEQMRSGEHAVLFRNNHFSTLYKHTDGHLYCLVTDEGYRGEEGVAWEKLDNEKGDTCYVSSSFEPYSVFKKRQQEEQEEVIRQIRLSEQVFPRSFLYSVLTAPSCHARYAAHGQHGEGPIRTIHQQIHVHSVQSASRMW